MLFNIFRFSIYHFEFQYVEYGKFLPVYWYLMVFQLYTIFSVTNDSRLPGGSPGCNGKCGPRSVLETPRNQTARWQVVPNQNRTWTRSFSAQFYIKQSLIIANSELRLQWSIWVLIVSQFDVYVKDALLNAVSPPAVQFAIRLRSIELL